MLEFVEGDLPENFLQDATVLNGLLEEINTKQCQPEYPTRLTKKDYGQ